MDYLCKDLQPWNSDTVSSIRMIMDNVRYLGRDFEDHAQKEELDEGTEGDQISNGMKIGVESLQGDTCDEEKGEEDDEKDCIDPDEALRKWVKVRVRVRSGFKLCAVPVHLHQIQRHKILRGSGNEFYSQ